MDTTHLLDELRQLEERLFAAVPADVERLLSDDFTEIGSSGRRYDKTQMLALLAPGRTHRITASEFTLQLLSPDLALHLYRTQNDAEPPATALRSSIWQRRDGAWQLRFHQGTVSSTST